MKSFEGSIMEGKEYLWTMDWSEKNVCIKCDEGGNLLVCSENDCLLAMHEKCMGCPARFDDAGHFYCPYCFYKQAKAESNRARENAMSKQKAFLIFERIGSEKHLEENKRAEAKRLNQSEGGANVNMMTCYDDKSRQGTDVILYQSVQTDEDAQDGIHRECTANLSPCRGTDASRLAKKNDILKSSENINCNEPDNSMNITSQQPKLGPIIACGNGVLCCAVEGTSQQFKLVKDDKFVQAEHEERVDGHKLNSSLQEDTCTKDFTQVQDPFISSRRKLDNIKMPEEHKISDAEEENIEKEVSQSSRASTGEDHSLTVHARSKRIFESSDSIDTDSEAVSVGGKRAKPSDKNKQKSQSVRSKKSQSVRSKRAKLSDKNKQKSQRTNPIRRSSSSLRAIKVFDDKVDTSRRATDIFGNGKRKRLMWRKEEEEMLKEGVQKFSSTERQNLPWRKILEFGRHVFDETRTPIDLKDKWRNNLAK